MARRGYGLMGMAREIERANKRANAEMARREREEIKYQKMIEKQRRILEKEEAIQYASELTEEAENERKEFVSLLNNINIKKKKFDWEKLKDNSVFEERLEVEKIPLKPDEENYKIKSSIVDIIFSSRKMKKEEEMRIKLESDLEEWNKQCEKYNEINRKKQEEWDKRKLKFETEQKEFNNEMKILEEKYVKGEKEGVEIFFNEMLSNREYPAYYGLDWDFQYNKENKMVVIEHTLPKKDEINKIKQVKYIQTRKEYSETYIRDSEINKIYENGIYQLSLRVTNDIYAIDELNNVESIVFNGYLTDINRSNGKEETKCILSLQSTKEKFSQLNLSEVDPKQCFKSFKGIAGAKLVELIPVAPIANINNEDRRFIESREIGEKIRGINLAQMHWEDFEHLIRELFEKEFSQNGSEVRITQSSRDGGVDAVMFDPDPIKGGKYVIQAKRYTNVVGVSAVRDLYGTVLNEGASKGILVTTSNYGADSYEFANDKPITLLNGANLLHMLEKHGYEARIDLNEAKLEINNKREVN
ncbi:restriction endonuclease [uncultured Clostridium sp.]|uniref:restriction endonuclease n=1 Tax=uncultured Clostridium sp. TaxID=59620 RepID=UPI00260F8684|nr:restriction endonuclease [uncultured Clostridium sp.]